MRILQTLDKWDKELFITLNRLHAPWLDPIMDWISYSMVPVVMILLLTIAFGAKAFGKKAALLVFLALANFGVTDSVSSRLFKPYFERLRPCHNPEFEGLYHTVGKCWGGQFGFVSSHAANTFGVAIFLWLVFQKAMAAVWAYDSLRFYRELHKNISCQALSLWTFWGGGAWSFKRHDILCYLEDVPNEVGT